MQPRIEILQAKKLIGIAVDMSLVDNTTFALFSSFMPNIRQIKNAMGSDIYEVMVYNTAYFRAFNPNNSFTKWATLEVNDFDTIPEGMNSFVIDSGLYAVFDFIGLPKDFGKLMQYIMMEWIPKSKYELDNRPHFNILGDKYKKGDPKSEETVYIPIKLI